MKRFVQVLILSYFFFLPRSFCASTHLVLDTPAKATPRPLKAKAKSEDKVVEGDKLALYLSIFSIGLSAVGIWYNNLKPSKIKVYKPKRISLAGDAFNPIDGHYTITIDHSFYNTGAKVGVIEDLIIILRNTTNDDKLGFRTFMEIIGREFSTTPMQIPHTTSYRSTIIKAKDSAFKTLYYRQTDLDRNFNLLPGIYELTIWFKTSKDATFQEGCNVSLEVSQQDIDIISHIEMIPADGGMYTAKVNEQVMSTIETEKQIKDFVNGI